VRPTLEDAICLAAGAHRGQVDKAGAPYILHVLRVVLRQDDETARIVAALHDVSEDAGVTISALAEAGYSQEIRDAVDCLTRREGEPYEEMITRVLANRIARLVKLADLEDNMDPRRKLEGEEASERLERYAAARERLISI
jgi:(p)ppGpp synthase/HD superfamily hydrolase